MYLSKRGYVVKKDDKNIHEIIQLKHNLMGKPLVDDKYIKITPPTFPLYIETQNKLYIPKVYGIQKYGLPDKILDNYYGKKWNTNITFNGQLLQHQKEPIDILIQSCRKNYGGILSMGAGCGKTVSLLYVLTQLQGKTIIVVNKIPLMNQWIEEIRRFLPLAKVSTIQGQNVDVDDCDIVVCMLQSLSRIDYPDSIFKDFNTTVVDECFPYETPVLTLFGYICIGDLYHKYKLHELPVILTFNEETHIFEYKHIKRIFKKQNKSFIELTLATGTLTSTTEHRYLTDKFEWVKANQLTLKHKLILYDKISDSYKSTPILIILNKHLINDIDVYDLELYDNHNYIILPLTFNTTLSDKHNGIIVHNCHNVGSKIFSQVLFKLCSQYTIGLSATPNRSDGCEYVFKYHLGEIIYQMPSERKGLSPIIKYVKLNSDNYKEITSINKITKQPQLQFTSMLSELIIMENRNKLIISLIEYIINTDNQRKILILSDRRQHLQLLYTLLKNVNFTYGLFLGGMKTSDLDQTRTSQVILATYKAFSEGISEKELDTLILVTPKKYIGHMKNTKKNESGQLEQIVGRIFRKNHIERNPIIIDFNDNFSVYKTQFNQRKTFYKNHFEKAIYENYIINLDSNNFDTFNLDQYYKPLKHENSKDKNIRDIIDNCLIHDDI